jgi:hypothetical protein
MNQRSDWISRDGFDEARREFENWRSRRTRGRRIPPALWKTAVDLAREHGVSRTAVTLGLDYYSLKGRLGAGARERDGAAGGTGGFVEMPPWAVASAPACVLEVADRRGRRLRIELQGAARGEIDSLARALWRGTRCSR